jgi:hypothetical protein
MSPQADFIVSNGTGAAVRSDLNVQFAAIVSNNSGATEPATMYAYQWWADTTAGLLKLRNSANSAWITMRQLDGEFSTVPVENGSAAAPSIYFKDSGTDSGFFSPGTDAVAISTAGTNRLHITSGGLVGIGTSSPAGILDVAGASFVRFANSTAPTLSNDTHAGEALFLRSGGSAGDNNVQALLAFGKADGGSLRSGSAIGAVQTTADADQVGLAFYTSSSSSSSQTLGERVRITHAGNVGIGTTSPNRNLEVAGAGATFVRVSDTTNTVYNELLSASSGGWVGTQTNHSLNFQTNNTERARIDTSGRLLVGTSSGQATNNGSDTGYNPQNQFAISDYDGVASFTNWTNIAGMNSNGGTVLFVNRCKSNTSGTHTGGALANGDKVGRIVFNASDGTAFRTAASIEAAMDNVTGASDVPGRLVFSTTADGASSPTERTRITSSGRLRSFGSDNIAFELATSSAAGTTNLLFSGNYGASGIGGGTECIRIYSNGNVQNTNNSYGAISDVKLKENVVDANSQWDDLKVLQVRNYNFKEETGQQTHTQIGLIAQEVELVSPGLVSESPDFDAEGNDLGTVTKSVNYSVLYMKAVKALQEAMERIEALEADVAQLKGA